VPTPNLSAHFNLGVQYEKKKMNKDAVQQFKQCLALDSQHFGAAIHLATQLANMSEYAKAQKYFKHSLRLNP